MSNSSCFACRMKCVKGKPVGYAGARRTMAAALKRASGGMLFWEELCNL